VFCQALSYRLAKRSDLNDWEKCVRVATMIAPKLRVTHQSVAGPQVVARRKLNQQRAKRFTIRWILMMAVPDDDYFSDQDRAALERALAEALEGESREQIRKKLETDSWFTVARFAAYSRQVDSLHLKPWQIAPLWIDPEEIDDILRGETDADSDEDVAAARLLKRMLSYGVSRFDPDPMGAIQHARAALRQGSRA
jgi:ribosomal protein S7